MVSACQIRREPKPTGASISYTTPTTTDYRATSALNTEPFPLLLLPTEIQLLIYRFAWTTGPEDPPHSVVNNLKDLLSHQWQMQSSSDSIQIRLRHNVQKQLSTVSAMGATCRHMRNVVYSEYFSRTQVLSQFNLLFLPQGGYVNNYFVRNVVERSLLLCEHVQHACVVVHDQHVEFAKCLNNHRLEWLTRLRKLKTLDVVFEHQGRFRDWRDRDEWRKGHPVLEAVKLRLQSLPPLEKLVFRLKRCQTEAQEKAISWEDVPWFQEFKQLFLENVTVAEVRCHPLHFIQTKCTIQREPLLTGNINKQNPERRCFKFDNHLGVTYYDWPCSYKI